MKDEFEYKIAIEEMTSEFEELLTLMMIEAVGVGLKNLLASKKMTPAIGTSPNSQLWYISSLFLENPGMLMTPAVAVILRGYWRNLMNEWTYQKRLADQAAIDHAKEESWYD